MRWGSRVLACVAVAVAVLVGPTPASAHQERESQFPPGTGSTPTYRPYAASTPRLVVCKPDSGARIASITDPALRARNQQLLDECAFQHIQAAVDAVAHRGTNIYVLPGEYREEPSHAPPCTKDYDGGVVSYELTVSCGEVVNLITVAGDDPADADIFCDGVRCDLQIEGTGARPSDVVVRGGFDQSGDWIKHNGLKADRADGFYLRNMAFELFRENAVYVHETDGYAIDRVVANHNDLYGILTFTSDHGLIKDCETAFNGDSGVYPGSAADVNKDSTSAMPPIARWSVEVTGCDTHHNALGFSGTAGNSVYFHDNRVHHNGAGYVTDSFVGGHPGMPQDHARLERNRIYANNSNYYEFVHSGVCARPPGQRGYGSGTVCPAFPVPVGTGVLIAGGNYNLVRDNDIYDNWRYGVMQFWVPGAIRGDYEPAAQLATSNGNRYVGNRMGRHPVGAVQPNGLDFWWDDQGVGNCWEDNTSAPGEVTHNALIPVLPDCSTGSLVPVGNVKDAALLPCAEYNREDNPDPVGCDWLDSPQAPAGREDAPDDAPRTDVAAAGASAGSAQGAAPDSRLPATGPPVWIATAGAALVALALALRARRRRKVVS
jgi:LPXTG-motif cell wall-anchored protein